MEEGRATPAPPPPSIPFWDNSSISLALAATMPYSSLCQWNNTASVAMDRAQQQLRAYADIAACEADASVFLHANYASFLNKYQNRDSAHEWTGYRRLLLQVDVLTTAKVQKLEGDTNAAAPGCSTGTARWIRDGTILTDYTTRLLAIKIIED